MDSKFLKKVFQLKEKPDFLISEENGHVFKIGERSGLKQNEFYTINSADIMEHRMNDQQKMNNRGIFSFFELAYLVADFLPMQTVGRDRGA